MRRNFPYPRATPAINMVTAMVLAGASVLFLGLSGDISVVWIASFAAATYGAVVVLYVTPLLTVHSISGDVLAIRYGLVFRADVPLSEVSGVRILDYGERARGALDLTTEKTRRVLIELASRRRFAHALWRSYDSIAISVEDVPGFVDAYGGGPT
jgi:hypothetical protein